MTQILNEHGRLKKPFPKDSEGRHQHLCTLEKTPLTTRFRGALLGTCLEKNCFKQLGIMYDSGNLHIKMGCFQGVLPNSYVWKIES